MRDSSKTTGFPDVWSVSMRLHPWTAARTTGKPPVTRGQWQKMRPKKAISRLQKQLPKSKKTDVKRQPQTRATTATGRPKQTSPVEGTDDDLLGTICWPRSKKSGCHSHPCVLGHEHENMHHCIKNGDRTTSDCGGDHRTMLLIVVGITEPCSKEHDERKD